MNSTVTATAWQIVETGNVRTVMNILAAAKNRSLFVGISDIAGAGKTCTAKLFVRNHGTNGAFFLECGEWGRKDFLTRLCDCVGIERTVSDTTTISLIIRFFNDHAALKPILILDEADKLKSAALRFLIPLYNGCEGNLSVVIAGTPSLEKQFKSGVLRNTKGYDELHSRFGRRFTKLPGATEGEVAQICAANGIADKKIQKAIFKECEPSSIKVGSEIRQMVYDMRRLKRVVERELLKIHK